MRRTVAREAVAATTSRSAGLTHTLRLQPGAPSLGAYRKELGRPVNPDLLATVVRWCREVAGLAQSSR